MAVNDSFYTPRKVPASEDKLKLLSLESNFYRTCNAVRENGIELHKLRNHIFNEILQAEMEKKRQIHQDASEKIKQLQVEKEKHCEEIRRLKGALKVHVATLNGAVVEVQSTSVDKGDDNNLPPLLSKKVPTVQILRHPVEKSSSSVTVAESDDKIDVPADKDDDPHDGTLAVVDNGKRQAPRGRKKAADEGTVIDTREGVRTRRLQNRRKTTDRKTSSTAAKKWTDVSKDEDSVVIVQEKEHHPQVISEESVVSAHSCKNVGTKNSTATILLDTSAEGSPFLIQRKSRRRRPPHRRVVVLSDEDDDDGVTNTKSNGETVTSKESKVKLGKRNRHKIDTLDTTVATTTSQQSDILATENTTTSTKRTRKASDILKPDAPLQTDKQVEDPHIHVVGKSHHTSSTKATPPQTKPRRRQRKRIVPKDLRRKQTARSLNKSDTSNDSIEMTTSSETADKDVTTNDENGLAAVLKINTSSTNLLQGTQLPSSTCSAASEERPTQLITREARLVLEKVSTEALVPGKTQVIPSHDIHQDTTHLDVSISHSDKQDAAKEVKKKPRRRKAQPQTDPSKNDDKPVKAAKAVRRAKPRAKRKTLNQKNTVTAQKKKDKEDEQIQHPTITVSAVEATNLVAHDKVSNPVKPSMIVSSQTSLTVGINPSHEPLRSISPEIPLQNTSTQDTSIIKPSFLTAASSHQEDDDKQGCGLSPTKTRKSLDAIVNRLSNAQQEVQNPPMKSPPSSVSSETEPRPSSSLSPLKHATKKRKTISKGTVVSTLNKDLNNTTTITDGSVWSDGGGSVGRRKEVYDGTASFGNPQTKRRKTFLSKRDKNASMFHLSIVEDKEAPRRRTVLSVKTRGVSAPKLKTANNTTLVTY